MGTGSRGTVLVGATPAGSSATSLGSGLASGVGLGFGPLAHPFASGLVSETAECAPFALGDVSLMSAATGLTSVRSSLAGAGLLLGDGFAGLGLAMGGVGCSAMSPGSGLMGEIGAALVYSVRSGSTVT